MTHDDLNHNLTITLTQEEMKEHTTRASEKGMLPIQYLKWLATQPKTITVNMRAK